jgi:hypothetical protein
LIEGGWILLRFEYLATPVVYAMGITYKRDDYIAVCRFIEEHLGVAGCDNLAIGFGCGLCEDLVNLALA